MKRRSDCLDYWGDFSSFAPHPNPNTPETHPIQFKRPKQEESEIKIEIDKRINYCLAPGDKLLECPYQKSHLILEQRWIRHLCKCRSNYLKECAARNIPITIGICKWNNGHHLQISLLPSHERFCPDRRGDESIYMDHIPETLFKPNLNLQSVSNNSFNKITHEEDRAKERLTHMVTDDLEQEDFNSSRRRSRSRTRKVRRMTMKITTEDWDTEPKTVLPNQPGYNPTETILRNNIPFIPIPPGRTKAKKGNFRVLQVARVRNGPVFNDNESLESRGGGSYHRRKSH